MGLFPKLKIYVQLLDKGCHIYENPKGDMFDLRSAQTVDLKCPQTGERYKKGEEYYRDTHFDSCLINLGVRIKLPDGCRANVPPRSGTFKNFHVLLTNSIGIIDNCYQGPNDQWKANFIAMDTCHIEGSRPAYEKDYLNEELTIIDGYVQGDRVCQFEVVLSQKATVWQKIKWFLHSGVKIVYVDNLDTVVDRGGFSSSGVK